MTETSFFDYELPEDQIAAVPADRRDESRLLVLDRETGEVRHDRFFNLPDYLREDDLLVMNDARVLPARLQARRETGGRVEILLVRPVEEPSEAWAAMLGSGGSLRKGEMLHLEDSQHSVTLLDEQGDGYWTIAFPPGAIEDILETAAMPLPPYVTRARRKRDMPERMPELDRERYQTVFARRPGAVAAPTAGLHFTDALLERIRAAGVEVRTLSLLVGPGTFRPVRSEKVEDHDLEAEFYELPAETAQAVSRALEEGRRVVATGTTTCRVLEYVVRTGRWEQQQGWTDLYIYPPFEFRVIGGLITNFHLPRSTLLMLVAAFAGREQVLWAYREAVRHGYRFYSYGDATFIC